MEQTSGDLHNVFLDTVVRAAAVFFVKRNTVLPPRNSDLFKDLFDGRTVVGPPEVRQSFAFLKINKHL